MLGLWSLWVDFVTYRRFSCMGVASDNFLWADSNSGWFVCIHHQVGLRRRTVGEIWSTKIVYCIILLLKKEMT